MTPDIVYAVWDELKAISTQELLIAHPEYLAGQLIESLLNRGIIPSESSQMVRDYVVSRIPLLRDLFCSGPSRRSFAL